MSSFDHPGRLRTGICHGVPVDGDAFVADLAETAARYLLADAPG